MCVCCLSSCSPVDEHDNDETSASSASAHTLEGSVVRTLDDGVIINAYNARIFKSAPGRTDANFRGTGNGEHEDDINYANNSKIFFRARHR